MSSKFPAALDILSTAHQDQKGEKILAGTINDLADAVNKIEAELGINPSGSYVDVATRLGVPFVGPLAPLAYSASITPNAAAASWQTITVTNTTAFAINAPTNPPGLAQTTELTIEILNSSGGVMGAITWNAVFVFAGGAWTSPASTKRRFARFEWNGSNWICTGVASADY